MGSIKSSFQFISYKIDRFKFDIKPYLGILESNKSVDENLWKIKIAIRQPIYFKSEKRYVGGLDVLLELDSPNIEIKKNNKGSNKKEKSSPLKLESGIAGAFAVDEGRFDKKIEESIVKHQFPAILYPYLRGAITTFLANAGFGSVIIPLINIYELAKKLDLNIMVVD